MASSHRPVPAHSIRGHFSLSPGTHPVCSHVSPSGGLDGLRRSSGGVSSGSCASGISSLPALCGSWPHLPIQCFVLRSVHGPAGLPSGYDSCIRSSFLGYPYESLPGRLARPGIVPGGPPPGSRGCLGPLSRVGDCGRPGVIPSLRLRWYFISGWSSSGGLDGLRRSSGGVSSGSCASGISSLPALCGSWPHLPIQCFVLRSVHGPAGLPSGYDSCIRSSFLGYPYESLPGRLACPGIVPGGPPPGSRGCLVPLSRVGDCGRPGVIPSLRLRWYFISGWSSTHGLLRLLHRQIASPGCGPPPTNSVLRSASCLLMAVTSGVAVLCHIWFQVAACG